MLHNDKDKFIKIIEFVQKQTRLTNTALVEKDYYLTLILSKINTLNDNLIFKGGTCLNKIYYSYFRLSEDLDFSMELPSDNITRSIRSKAMQSTKENIGEYIESFGLRLDKTVNPGRNENKQYVFMVNYDSVVTGKTGTIKLEIGLRFNPLLKAVKRKVNHNFIEPLTNKVLIDTGEIKCLDLKEAVAEKLRAAAGREIIAPRDFYDLDYLIRNNFNIIDPEVLALFKKKTIEDYTETESKWKGLPHYAHNLGRTAKEITDMRLRISDELYDVLSLKERENFNIDDALTRINKLFKNIS